MMRGLMLLALVSSPLLPPKCRVRDLTQSHLGAILGFVAFQTLPLPASGRPAAGGNATCVLRCNPQRRPCARWQAKRPRAA